MLSIYEYRIEFAPSEACKGLDWQIVFNGRTVARFASEDAAVTTARMLSAVDREAGRNPTLSIEERHPGKAANDHARSESRTGS